MKYATMSPIGGGTMSASVSDSSAMLELSRSALEDSRQARADIKEMAAQMAQSARDDVKELTKMMLEREDKMAMKLEQRDDQTALKLEQLRQELLSPRPTQTPAQTDEAQARGWGLPSWGIGGWLLRLVVVYVVLRRRRLAMLIGQAFGPRAPLRVS